MTRGFAGLLCVLLLAGCPEEEPSTAPLRLPDLPAVAGPPAATLVTLGGQVSLERDGGVGPAAVGPLFEDDVVATGPASSAVLRDLLGRELELGEETRFKVGAKFTSVEVLAGDISFLSDDDGGSGWSGLSVRTPFGTARLSEGATGRLRFVDGGVFGDVTFGTIEFDVPDAGTRAAKAGESFGVSFGALEFDAPPAPDAPATVGFVVETGRPQVKRPTDKRFVAAAAKDALPADTAFQVPAGASARLDGRHVKASLAAGTSGVVQGERTVEGVSTLGLSKFIGPLTLQFSGQGPARVDLPDVSVSSGAEASVAVTKVGKKQRVEVRAGEATVTVKGVPTQVKAGEVVLVDAVGAVQVPGPRPGLVVNASTRVRVHDDGARELALVLPEGGGKVEVARDADFSAPFIRGKVAKQVVVPVTSRAPLHFRLLDEAGQPAKQGRIDFLPDHASARDTATRSDTVSETGQKATVFYQSKVPALTFAFASQAEAKGWRFRLYKAEALEVPVVDKRTTEPKFQLEPGVLQEGEFLWSATALDASGAEKAGTRMNKLSIVYDNARTSLRIDRPLPGERAGAGMVASGVAPRGAQLFVNGKPARFDDSGRFSVPVGAVDAVVFRVVAGDTESWWVRRLKR